MNGWTDGQTERLIQGNRPHVQWHVRAINKGCQDCYFSAFHSADAVFLSNRKSHFIEVLVIVHGVKNW